jgi:acyl carrier protein phosphodiesterase
MNFFGHAAVASWSSPAPGTVLGAMLPDFATMVRSRLADPTDDSIAAGIAHHHATDAAFHGMPAVLGLMRELDERLAALSCARGPRRAVAHIGVELLLDGVLVTEPAYRDVYTTALAHDPSGVRWRDDDGPPRFETLLARLRTYGPPDDLRKPHAITQRLHRMLAHRPLLAPSSSDLEAIDKALAAYQTRVEAAADTVLRGLRASP